MESEPGVVDVVFASAATGDEDTGEKVRRRILREEEEDDDVGEGLLSVLAPLERRRRPCPLLSPPPPPLLPVLASPSTGNGVLLLLITGSSPAPRDDGDGDDAVRRWKRGAGRKIVPGCGWRLLWVRILLASICARRQGGGVADGADGAGVP